MVNKDVFRYGLIKTRIAKSQAEVKVFKVAHAKDGVQSPQLVPRIPSDGNAKKVTTVCGQQQPSRVGVEPGP